MTTNLNPADISARKAKLIKIKERLCFDDPSFLLDDVEKQQSQECTNCVKEKDTETILK